MKFTLVSLLLLGPHLRMAKGAAMPGNPSFVPLMIGQSMDPSDIYRGFKLNIEKGESPIKDEVFTGNFKKVASKNSHAVARTMKRESDIKDMLGIQGNVGVSYGPVSGDATGSYLENQVSSKYSATIFYQSIYTVYTEKAIAGSIVPHPESVGLGQDEIAESYGTNFIDSVVYGAQLEVKYTITSDEEIDIEELDVEIIASIGIGKLSGTLRGKFQTQQGESHSLMSMKIEVKTSGVDFAIPGNPSFEEVHAVITQFNTEYETLLANLSDLDAIDDETNELNKLSPIGFTLSSIADYQTKLDHTTAALLDSRMEDLHEIFFDTLFWKANLKKSLAEMEAAYGDPKMTAEQFDPYEEEVMVAVGDLDAKLQECFDYRRQPLETIVSGTATVPFPYVIGDVEAELRALVGKAYIYPLKIEGQTFSDLHYVGYGYGVYEGGKLVIKPWLRGSARQNFDNTVVATAETAQELLVLVEEHTQNSLIPAGAVKYLDSIVLQLQIALGRWMFRSRYHDNAKTGDGSNSNIEFYTFEIQPKSHLSGSSYTDATCVKYGDTVYLQSGPTLWLTGARWSTNQAVEFRDPYSEGLLLRTHYEWQIRSAIPINGSRNLVDPKHGECLFYNDDIFLQNNYMDYRWLSGARSNGCGQSTQVDVRDILGSRYEQSHYNHYTWKVQTGL